MEKRTREGPLVSMKLTINLRYATENLLTRLYVLLRNSELHSEADTIIKEIRRRNMNPHEVLGNHAETDANDNPVVDCGNDFSFEGETKENLEAELGFKL